MPLELAARQALSSDPADMEFCALMARSAGLGWTVETAVTYADNPRVFLGLVEGTWPERGFNELTRILACCGVWPESGKQVRATMLAIDMQVLDEADVTLQQVRHHVIDVYGRRYMQLIRQQLGDGAKVLVGPLPDVGPFTKLMQYFDTLPQELVETEPDGRKSYVLDVDALLGTFDARV